MSDSEPDLYSFLQSKNFAQEDDAADDSETPDSEVQTVDSFDQMGDPADAADSDVQEEFGYNFDDDELGEALRTCSDDTLNNAPFGIVQVDDDGIVQFYNRYESRLAGVDPEDALGRNFFTQLAPCSSNRLFHGRFKKGIRQGTLDERFTYTFTYKMSPTLVQVRMYKDQKGNNWIMIRKR
jgi:photoactive yellow protein